MSEIKNSKIQELLEALMIIDSTSSSQRVKETRKMLYLSILRRAYNLGQENVLFTDKEGYQILGEDRSVTFEEFMEGETITSKLNTL